MKKFLLIGFLILSLLIASCTTTELSQDEKLGQEQLLSDNVIPQEKTNLAGEATRSEVYYCHDEDEKNFFLKGVTEVTRYYRGRQFTNTYEDACKSETVLKEYYCSENNNLAITEQTCDNGCVDGACMEKEIEYKCVDSDNGKDYFVKGVVTQTNSMGGSSVNEDFCVDDNQLNESFCDGVNPGSDSYTCPNGCVDGACVNNNNNNNIINLKLSQGETKTITMNDVDYVVSVLYVGEMGVKLTINGELSPVIKPGYSFKLSSGVFVSVDEFRANCDDNYAELIFSNDRPEGKLVSNPSGEGLIYSNLSPEETRTFTVNGVDYEVILAAIIDGRATFMVNGDTKILGGKDTTMSLLNADLKVVEILTSCGFEQVYFTITPKPVISCQDSDGGLYKYVKGVVTKGDQLLRDSCSSSTDPFGGYHENVLEAYCETDGNINIRRIICGGEGSCQDGACVQ